MMTVVDLNPVIRVCVDNRLDASDNGRKWLCDGVVDVSPKYGDHRYKQASNTPTINDDDVKDILPAIRELGTDEPRADTDGCKRCRCKRGKANN